MKHYTRTNHMIHRETSTIRSLYFNLRISHVNPFPKEWQYFKIIFFRRPSTLVGNPSSWLTLSTLLGTTCKKPHPKRLQVNDAVLLMGLFLFCRFSLGTLTILTMTWGCQSRLRVSRKKNCLQMLQFFWKRV